ncbi:hypothetical protein COL21_12580 [Bacillus thuringiensis]|uniref:hypothetical protein n=1 Tax=Bacillus thuringiensis TaxID=1428 RepID=UPI000BF69C5F|nr:hypothetical protein [Bacillus thuringiensis]PFV97155.1 hypothetical protein COL21_12580 [Bacillus thuringiensis]
MNWYTSYTTNQQFSHQVPYISNQSQQIPPYQQPAFKEISRTAESSTRPDFYNAGEYRQGRAYYYNNLSGHGVFERALSLPGVNSTSIVVASITEVAIIDGQVKPKQGSASMQIYNVVPRDDGTVSIRGNIDWPNDLNYRISVIIF